MAFLYNILYLSIFFAGASFGSFLSVLIDRIPKNESFIFSRSRCQNCSKLLIWYDLIPLFSCIVLLGRCRYCKSLIPKRLFFVEVITGIVFVFLFIHSFSLPYTISLMFLIFLYNIIIASSLIVIFFCDLEYGIIPDQILIILAVVLIIPYVFFDSPGFFSNMLVGIGSLAFFLFIFLATRGRGMGFGDVKFAFLLGFLLGLFKTIIALYTAFLTGAVISLILILLRKKKFKKDTVPFGPFLVTGVLVAVIFGDKILNILKLI